MALHRHNSSAESGEVLFTGSKGVASLLVQGFSNFWCYGAHEEIDHNLRSPTINF